MCRLVDKRVYAKESVVYMYYRTDASKQHFGKLHRKTTFMYTVQTTVVHVDALLTIALYYTN